MPKVLVCWSHNVENMNNFLYLHILTAIMKSNYHKLRYVKFFFIIAHNLNTKQQRILNLYHSDASTTASCKATFYIGDTESNL